MVRKNAMIARQCQERPDGSTEFVTPVCLGLWEIVIGFQPRSMNVTLEDSTPMTDPVKRRAG